jgi:hypothetical protein
MIRKFNIWQIVLYGLFFASFLFFLTMIINERSLFPQKKGGKYKYRFIGIEKCQVCHETESTGNQHEAWLKDPHSLAYHKLSRMSPRLQKIIKKNNISSPEKKIKCLKCHTTGGYRTDNYFKEGIGCEACHGPGEKYNTFEEHVGTSGYKKALKAGMYDIIGDDKINNRKKMCLRCHQNSRPCLPENPALAKKQELTLQQIVVSFPHKVKK